MPIHQIRFRQSGGFAGLIRGVEVPASELSAGELRALEQYATSGRAPARSTAARDLLNYEIELDTDGGSVRLEFDESRVPDQLSGLVASLAKRSRPQSP